MKGLKIIRADLSNFLDVFALFDQAVKEKVFPVSRPTKKQFRDFYTSLTRNHLVSKYERFYLAKRGRGYLGVLHVMFVPGQWTIPGKEIENEDLETAVINPLFVTKNRREKGIGNKLLNFFKKDIEDLDIKNIDLLAEDHVVKYWQKRGAKPLTNYMRMSYGG